MRTTLDIDEKVLDTARDRARVEGVSIGRIISEMAIAGIEATTVHGEGDGLVSAKNGLLVLDPARGRRVTIRDVQRALDDDA